MTELPSGMLDFTLISRNRAPDGNAKVLLVDDDRGLVDMLSMALEDAGFAVERACPRSMVFETVNRR